MLRLFRFLLRGWFLSFLGWGLIAIVLGGHFMLTTGGGWNDAVLASLRQWLPWAVFTPLLVALVEWLPLDRERWRFAFPAHLLCCVATIAACEWWSFRFDPFRGPMPRPLQEFARRGPPRDFPERRGPRPGPPGRFDLFRIVGSRLPIYLAIVSAAHALLFLRRARERERRSLGLQASLAQARLEALKMQLQPHFLFNSLNAIAELVHTQPAAAEEMLVALSDLLRLTLSTSGEQELPLARELEFVEHYLAIQRVRFGDRLRFEREVDAAALDALVPTFLLQPLVENAVRHGIEPRQAPGVLTISAGREGGQLRLRVADDGVGLSGGRPAREGIGLANTRARLRELYGDAGALSLRNGQGVVVEIVLPWRTTVS